MRYGKIRLVCQEKMSHTIFSWSPFIILTELVNPELPTIIGFLNLIPRYSVDISTILFSSFSTWCGLRHRRSDIVSHLRRCSCRLQLVGLSRSPQLGLFRGSIPHAIQPLHGLQTPFYDDAARQRQLHPAHPTFRIYRSKNWFSSNRPSYPQAPAGWCNRRWYWYVGRFHRHQ